ncbi:MAG: hypothetical protein JKX98_11380 [Alcanivoracaceae bacterium]|nr:hypothetical protein [Alcanivoracaceae bacterium]
MAIGNKYSFYNTGFQKEFLNDKSQKKAYIHPSHSLLSRYDKMCPTCFSRRYAKTNKIDFRHRQDWVVKNDETE